MFKILPAKTPIVTQLPEGFVIVGHTNVDVDDVFGLTKLTAPPPAVAVVDVNVIPLLSTNVPPALTLVALPLDTVNTVGLMSTVTVKLFVLTTSAGPGKTLDAT
jgi:hypothetical protein